MRSLEQAFDDRRNGFTVLRLVFAASVVTWHSVSLGGYEEPLTVRFLSELGVDCFFALSGFLVTRSWMEHRSLPRFLWHRFLRIFPGFWACLVVTATAATVVAVWQGRPLSSWLTAEHGPLQYVGVNAGLHISFFDIAGTPTGVPYPGWWNTPLWTLRWEALCYLGIAGLGLVASRLRTSRWSWVAVLLLPQIWGASRVILHGSVHTYVRFACVFAAGALLYVIRDRIPLNRWLMGAAALLVAPALLWLPDYQGVAAIPLAYLVLTIGTTFTTPRLIRENDISYGVYVYGYVIQQLLVIAGLHLAGYVVFTCVALLLVVPGATLSWTIVERPSMRLRNAGIRLPRHSVARGTRHADPPCEASVS